MGGHLKTQKITESNIACFYSVNSGKGCARKRQADGSIKDLRGDDPNACLLYEEGKPPHDQRFLTLPKWERGEVF